MVSSRAERRMIEMEELLPVANQIAELLIARKETIAVAESSAAGSGFGGPIVRPGASAYREAERSSIRALPGRCAAQHP